jgi:hypothetical protein
MKKFLMLFSGAIIGICSLSQAQSRDTSTNYNQQAPVEEKRTKSDDMKTNDAERVEGTTDQQLQQDADALEKNFEGSTIDKVGPNGEKLFMEKGKYYYYDADGKKVKVKKSDVRDKSVGEKPGL